MIYFSFQNSLLGQFCSTTNDSEKSTIVFVNTDLAAEVRNHHGLMGERGEKCNKPKSGRRYSPRNACSQKVSGQGPQFDLPSSDWGLDLDHVSEQEPENGPTWSAWGSHLVIVALATGIPQSPQGRGDLLPPVFDEQSFVTDL